MLSSSPQHFGFASQFASSQFPPSSQAASAAPTPARVVLWPPSRAGRVSARGAEAGRAEAENEEEEEEEEEEGDDSDDYLGAVAEARLERRAPAAAAAAAAAAAPSPPAPVVSPLPPLPPPPGLAMHSGTIWGTNVSLSEVKLGFRVFLVEFALNRSEEFLAPAHYLEILREKRRAEMQYRARTTTRPPDWSLNVDMEHLRTHDAALHDWLERYPADVLPVLDDVAQAVYDEETSSAGAGAGGDEFGSDAPGPGGGGGGNNDDPDFPRLHLRVRPFHLRLARAIRDLNPEDIGRLVSVRGMVTRTSSVIPDLHTGFFVCEECGAAVEQPVSRGVLVLPAQCGACSARNALRLEHNRCQFEDKQWVKLQETPDAIPEGETPHSVSVFVYDEMVDGMKPGDRVEIVGLYSANEVSAASGSRVRSRALRAVFRTHIDVVHFAVRAAGRLDAVPDLAARAGEGGEREHERADVEARIRALARDPRIYERLACSVAPSVWGLDDVKKGIVCMLFGGTNKELAEGGLGRFRGEINVLLCGDPGTSKSQLLQYVHKIAPRGVYTSGKGSSAVGLTAYITRDPETREAVLESGALVLSDRGVCCIDEFDKMNDHTRSVLHEAMEQQTVSVAKAGIITTLNSRTAVLASANPVESRYNPNLSVVENIQLPPTLLSRFDLIYLVLDKPDEAQDRRLASHVVSLYFRDADPPDADIIDRALLTQFISFAKANVHPVLSPEACDELVDGYVAMRRLGGRRKTITATPRQIESVIRIGEALAKCRLSDTVVRADIVEALRLMRAATQQAATDPRTGRIDMDLITTGRSTAGRQRVRELAREVQNRLAQERTTSVRADHLFRLMRQQASVDIPQQDFFDALRLLQDEDVVVLTGPERNPFVRRL